MQIKNTNDKYGLIAIALHWIVAIGFFACYMSVYYRHWFTDKGEPANWTALQLHLSFGITVAVFVALRIIWKVINKQPEHLPGNKLEHIAASAIHYVLYAIMIITGYLGTGVDTQYFQIFDITMFKDTTLYNTLVTNWLNISWQIFEPPIDFIHKQGGKFLVWVLILAHAGAALYHHFIIRDKVLQRMISTK
jgi:cytochrome b561